MTERNPILTESWLRQRHHAERQRIADMAREAQCTTTTVRSALDRFGVERRDDRAGRNLPSRRARLDVAEVKRLYLDRKLASDRIASILGVDTSTILRALRREGVAIRGRNDTKRGVPARNRVQMDAENVVAKYMMDGASMRTVAAELGVSMGVVARVLREAGAQVKGPEPGRYVGAKNPNWKPDLTDEDRRKRRDTSMQAQWRERVYERDGYRCQCCGDDRGGNLHAHHVEAHAENFDVRWRIENGITLCAPCHRGFHRAYGLKRINREKLDAFISAHRQGRLAA